MLEPVWRRYRQQHWQAHAVDPWSRRPVQQRHPSRTPDGTYRQGNAQREVSWTEPLVDPIKVHELRDEGMGPVMIARELKIGRASVYRALAA